MNSVVDMSPRGLGLTYWARFVLVIAIAVAVRWMFFTGFLGSDEVTYTKVAVEIAQGHLIPYSYAGAWRYGVNLPNALSIWLFGVNEFSSSLWGFMCSVGEVGLIFAFAWRVWGQRAAVAASLVAAFVPLHVHLAGRTMADPPLAFFITLAFILFWIAEQQRHITRYVVAGFAAGFVFWVKESVGVFFLGVFVLYALLQRRWNFKWLWMACGWALMVGANLALFWYITGNPLHIFQVFRETAHLTRAVLVTGASSPGFYLWYLFLDIRHVSFMAYLALGGLLIWAWHWRTQRVPAPATGYVVLWAVGLMAIFSLIPLSLDPFLFITKQTNYMMIFMAPLCLMSGYFLAQLSRNAVALIAVPYLVSAMVLSALEQQAIHVFVANSKASVAFARAHRDTPVFAMPNAFSAGLYAATLQPDGKGVKPLRSIERMMSDLAAMRGANPVDVSRLIAYAIIDTHTLGWGDKRVIKSIKQIPDCWVKVETLQPTGYGVGLTVIEYLHLAVGQLPNAVAERAHKFTTPLLRPLPAYVFAIPGNCEFSL